MHRLVVCTVPYTGTVSTYRIINKGLCISATNYLPTGTLNLHSSGKITLNNSITLKPFVKGSDADDTFLRMKEEGPVGRLDANASLPKVFRGPVINNKSEPEQLWTFKKVIRMGRAV